MIELEKHGFGRTNMRVSKLGLGGHQLAYMSTHEVRSLLDSTLDMGINVIDTAECYGSSEEQIGQALGRRRKECYLFTKCGHASESGWSDWQPQLLERNVEQSLQRLKTDYLDMVQLHSCSYQQLVRGEVIEVLQRLRQAGKTRYIGYSGDRRAARYAVQCGAFDSLQISVNISDQEALDEIIPRACAAGMGVIIKRPLANVAWLPGTGHDSVEPDRRIYMQRLQTLNYEFLKRDSTDQTVAAALRFTASIPGVGVVLMGTTNVRRLAQHLAAVETGPLAPQCYEAIRQRWKAVVGWRKYVPGGRWGWHGLK